nr:Hemolysin A [uncultured bacterium]
MSRQRKYAVERIRSPAQAKGFRLCGESQKQTRTSSGYFAEKNMYKKMSVNPEKIAALQINIVVR